MKFRKKPVVIEATQWSKNGDHPEDFATDKHVLENGELRIFTVKERQEKNLEGGIVRYYRTWRMDGQKECSHCGVIMQYHGWIDSLEGGHIVCPGDWIITGIEGERYPCKPDIFASTYEPVFDAPHDGRQQPAQAQSDLVKRLRELQGKVADGRIDLRDVGKILFGKFDQDLPAEMIDRAIRIEALEAAAARQSEREAALLLAIRHLWGWVENWDCPFKDDQDWAEAAFYIRNAMAAYDTPAVVPAYQELRT